MAELEDVTLDGKPLHSLRVADLKAALEQRGLAKSGQKTALIKRLKGVSLDKGFRYKNVCYYQVHSETRAEWQAKYRRFGSGNAHLVPVSCLNRQRRRCVT